MTFMMSDNIGLAITQIFGRWLQRRIACATDAEILAQTAVSLSRKYKLPSQTSLRFSDD
jgi:hypothetical protein